MVRKKTSKQNIAIIILSILLLISIGFGITYSYYNGKSNLAKGSITTANLSIELQDGTGKTTEFLMSAPINDGMVVCGQDLFNVQLNLFNKANTETYIVVVYSLSAHKNDATGEDVTDRLSTTPAIEFKQNGIGEDWVPITYTCKSGQIYTCLVGKNAFRAKNANDGSGYPIKVLDENSVKTPGKEWGNVLQGCSVTISVMAYAAQTTLPEEYIGPIGSALNTTEKAQAIARAVLQICEVDK